MDNELELKWENVFVIILMVATFCLFAAGLFMEQFGFTLIAIVLLYLLAKQLKPMPDEKTRESDQEKKTDEII